MAKGRKKNRRSQNQPAKVHRYSAEIEEKKAAKKRLKYQLIIAGVIAAILLLLGSVLF